MRHIFISMQIDFLIFDGAPKSLDENIVAPGSLAVHADVDPGFLQDIRERYACELAALIRVENIRFAILKQCLFKGGNAKIHLQRDGQTPRQNPS